VNAGFFLTYRVSGQKKVVKEGPIHFKSHGISFCIYDVLPLGLEGTCRLKKLVKTKAGTKHSLSSSDCFIAQGNDSLIGNILIFTRFTTQDHGGQLKIYQSARRE